MPYKQFLDWAFSSDQKLPLPKPIIDENGKEKINILKYNSPINVNYLLPLFILNGPLNLFLNTWLNNSSTYYIEKEELLLFIKKCIKDYKIQRNSIPYINRSKKDTKLYTVLRKRIPTLKNYDVDLLCDLIDRNEEEKSLIYHSLNLEKPEKVKQKKLSDRSEVKETNVKKYLEKNFSLLKS